MGNQKPKIRFKGTYGITEQKKAALDALIVSVDEANRALENLQADESSLTEKLKKFKAFLEVAASQLELSLSNKKVLDEIIKSALDLQLMAEAANAQTELAETGLNKVTTEITSVVDDLIIAVELLNKLSITIIARKSSDQLISDELISKCNLAVTDANNAVALSLVALESSFAAQASTMTTNLASGQVTRDATFFYQVLIGESKRKPNHSLQSLVDQAYTRSEMDYEEMKKACDDIEAQLSQTKAELNKARVKLQSLEAGLAAANAAALAS